MKHQSKNNEKEINVEDGRRNEPECADKQPVEEGQSVTDKSDGNDDSLEDMHAKIADLQDKYLRTVAEFDNYRKRTIKEKADLILSGSEKAVSAILPILDDMERAIDNAGKTEDVQALRDGLELIYKKFEKTLEGMGVKKIDSRKRFRYRGTRSCSHGSRNGERKERESSGLCANRLYVE